MTTGANILSTPYRPRPKTQLELARLDLFEFFADLIEAEDAELIVQWLESHGECA